VVHRRQRHRSCRRGDPLHRPDLPPQLRARAPAHRAGVPRRRRDARRDRAPHRRLAAARQPHRLRREPAGRGRGGAVPHRLLGDAALQPRSRTRPLSSCSRRSRRSRPSSPSPRIRSRSR
jgi:hypothetical protein